MTLRLVEDSECAGLRRLAQIALRKHEAAQNPAAATRHLLTAAIHLHAIEVGGAQAVLDMAEHMADFAANHRVCTRTARPSDPSGGA